MLDVGSICLIKEASLLSIVEYQKYRKVFPTVLCPCSVPSIQRIKITDLLPNGFALVQYTNDISKISIVAIKDLVEVDDK